MQNQGNFRRMSCHYSLWELQSPLPIYESLSHFSPKAVKRMPINGRRRRNHESSLPQLRTHKKLGCDPLCIIPFSLVLLVSDLLLILTMYFSLCIFISQINAFFTSQAIKYPYTIINSHCWQNKVYKPEKVREI